jgi:four helix bundle protein
MDLLNRSFDLEQRLLAYSVSIIPLAETMHRTRAALHVADHLLRAGTSPLLCHGKAQAAESAADFVHKMSICLKELRETRRCLLLTQQVPLVRTPSSVDIPLQETEELIRIFYRSIETAKKRTHRKGSVHER